MQDNDERNFILAVSLGRRIMFRRLLHIVRSYEADVPQSLIASVETTEQELDTIEIEERARYKEIMRNRE